MKKTIIPLAALLLLWLNAEAQKVKLWGFGLGGKKWWYENIITDRDGDGDPGSQAVNSVFQKSSPGATWQTTLPVILTSFDCNDTIAAVNHSATEVCNFIDDDCDGLSDENFQHFSYYADANGDGYGDDSTPVIMCDTIAPEGYASNLPVVADIVFTSTGKTLTPHYWLFNVENLFYDKKKFYDPLTGNLHDRIIALQPDGFMYSGSASHYHQFRNNDTTIYAPVGYNSIPTTNEMTPTGIAWKQSHFASTVELARQTGGGLLIQSSPTEDCASFLSLVNWMELNGVPFLGLYVDQEYSDPHWADCANCGNGDAVANDGTFWFGCVQDRDFPKIIDNVAVPLNPIRVGSYAEKIRATVGYNSQRFYWAPSKGTPNLSSTMSIQQLADSFDYAIAAKLPQIASSVSGRAFIASLYPEDIDPRGGRLASSGTWLNAYFVVKSYIAALREDSVNGVVFGRFDLLDVKATNTNLLYSALQTIAPFFHGIGEIYSAAGLDAVAVESGAALVVNRTGTGKDVNYLSLDGYIRPVVSITQLAADSLGDTSPDVRTTSRIEPYSISLIKF